MTEQLNIEGSSIEPRGQSLLEMLSDLPHDDNSPIRAHVSFIVEACLVGETPPEITIQTLLELLNKNFGYTNPDGNTYELDQEMKDFILDITIQLSRETGVGLE